jgi:exodeoxyribonuclease V alpha subunit
MATAPDGPRVVVVTGSPGVGKTTVIRAIVEHYERAGLKIVLAAPTGKAALRMIQQTGRPACTIHRMLEPTPGPRGRFFFARNASCPIAADVVILDEVSMVDARLMADVCAALPATLTRLVVVGDIDQLPAVGPGAILGDLIASEHVPVARLTTIKRQDPGPLLRAIHSIKDGRAPRLDNDPAGDIFFEEVAGAADVGGVDEDGGPRERDANAEQRAIAARVLELVLDRLSISRAPALAGKVNDRLRDIQVITPTREKGDLSAKALSDVFQARLFPEQEGRFRIGDKVLQTKNDYSLGIVNGDIGFVRDFGFDSTGRKVIEVEFDEPIAAAAGGVGAGGRLVQVPAGENALTLAYAVTCHKYQGSEAPVIVIPLHVSMAFSYSRAWIYTAISRARNCCILVGDRSMIARAVRSNRSARRVTGLASMIKEGARARAP